MAEPMHEIIEQLILAKTWPDGASVRWEVRDGDEVIDSGHIIFPNTTAPHGWTVNSATGEILSYEH